MGNEITRRRFITLAGIAGLSSGVIIALEPPGRRAECLSLDGEERRKKTLESLANVLLPGAGTHGTSSGEPGVLQTALYGKPFYAHLLDPYYGIDQENVSKKALALDWAAKCLSLVADGFWALGCEEQLGLVAFITRHRNEGEPPHLSFLQKVCLEVGGAASRGEDVFELAVFVGIIFYSSKAGSDWLRSKGYPGPNWGFNPANGWAPIPAPNVQNQPLHLFGGFIPSIAPGTVPSGFAERAPALGVVFREERSWPTLMW